MNRTAPQAQPPVAFESAVMSPPFHTVGVGKTNHWTVGFRSLALAAEIVTATGSGDQARSDRLHRATALGPVLEAPQVAHVLVAQLLQYLAGQRRAAARGAVEDHRSV